MVTYSHVSWQKFAVELVFLPPLPSNGESSCEARLGVASKTALEGRRNYFRFHLLLASLAKSATHAVNPENSSAQRG